jgi:hypothetical protein
MVVEYVYSIFIKYVLQILVYFCTLVFFSLILVHSYLYFDLFTLYFCFSIPHTMYSHFKHARTWNAFVLYIYAYVDSGSGAHGHQCSYHFQNFENFKISHFYVFKNYGVKYIDRYIQKKCMQKNPIKNTLYFGRYKKDKFLIVNSIKILVR